MLTTALLNLVPFLSLQFLSPFNMLLNIPTLEQMNLMKILIQLSLKSLKNYASKFPLVQSFLLKTTRCFFLLSFGSHPS